MPAWESGCSVTSPSVLGKGKACSSGNCAQENLSKQSLRGYVSVKLSLEICINKASSNSRLTTAGRRATASDRHSQSCFQTLFFFSLPLMRQQPNYTCLLKNLLKLYCFWTWDTLWCFFVLFCFVFFSFDETTTELLLRHHLQDWRLRDKHQNY
jgi:hypothetical protein